MFTDWLDMILKFFSYSSIQVKIVASLMAVIIFFIIRRVIQRYAINNIKDAIIRYRSQKILSYTTFTLSAIIVGQIWFKGIQSITTYLGLLSAGIAIALKDPLVNLIGWQSEDIYQNLVITYIYEIQYNQKIDVNIFKLPKRN